MKRNSLLALSGFTAACVIGSPVMSSEFMINQMIDAYCSIMKGENAGVMNSYDQGMNEGIAIENLSPSYSVGLKMLHWQTRRRKI